MNTRAAETGPLPETADIETSSEDYARRFAGPVGAWMLSVQEQAVCEGLAEFPGARVLDVGGGHGQLAGPLARRGYAVTVLGSAEVCRHRIAELVDSGRCRYITGNVLALPFEDKAFDVVTSVRLLPHCERWPELIAELSRVARHAVIVDYPALSPLNRLAPWLFGLKKKLEGNTRTWISFRHADVADAFSAHGMRVDWRRGQFFWPMVLHRRLKRVGLSRALEKVAAILGLTRACGSPIVLKATAKPVDAPSV